MILSRILIMKIFWIIYFDIVSCRLGDQSGLDTPVAHTVNKDCVYIFKYRLTKEKDQPEK